MPHKTPDSCLVMEWLPEGLKRSLKRKKPPTPVGGGSFGELIERSRTFTFYFEPSFPFKLFG